MKIIPKSGQHAEETCQLYDRCITSLGLLIPFEIVTLIVELFFYNDSVVHSLSKCNSESVTS